MGLLSGNGLGAFKSVDRTNFVSTAGQTTFTMPQGYTVGDIDVYLNGIKLVDGDDYNAINGTSIILTLAATAGDTLSVISHNQFNVANTYTKSESDTRYMVASGANPMTSYLRAPNYGVSSWSDSATASLEASVGSGEQGVGIKAFGRSISNNGGNLHYTTDTRGAGGAHKFYGWNGTVTTPFGGFDPSGRWTSPNQVCFNAYRSTAYSTSGNGTTNLVWDQTHVNRGSVYNTSTGRFTAPVAGAYYFMAYQLTGNDASTGDVRVCLNGNVLAGNYGYGSNTTNHKQMRVSTLLQLAVNDFVEIRSWGSQNWNDAHGGFCGFLIG